MLTDLERNSCNIIKQRVENSSEKVKSDDYSVEARDLLNVMHQRIWRNKPIC